MAKHSAAMARMLTRDCVLRCHTPLLRVSGAQTSASARVASSRFAITNPRVSELLAKTITAAIILASFQRDEERVIIQLLDDRSTVVRRLYAEAMAWGEVRGFAAGPGIEETDSAAWGDGRLSAAATLTVSRILYGGASPVSSTIRVDTGDIESDLLRFFTDSEQVDSAVHLEAESVPGGQVVYAGGAVVQALATDGGHAATSSVTWSPTTMSEVRERVRGASKNAFAADHARGVSLATALAAFVPDVAGAVVVSAAAVTGEQAVDHARPVFLKTPVDFLCRCSKSRLVESLRTMPDAAEHVFGRPGNAQGVVPTATLTCQFCNEHYVLTVDDVLDPT